MATSTLLLVTGSRSIKDREQVWTCLDQILDTIKPTQLIHGGAVGVDMLAGEWAQDQNLPVIVKQPDFKRWPIAQYRWKAYGERDKAMVDMADAVVAIWDGKSSGTKLTMDEARRQDKLRKYWTV